jgi:photosystem II stability/assembly factor-like uncharacterized protein
MRRAVPSLLAVVCLPLFTLAAQIDAAALGRLQPRNIGPAGMSGRVAAIAAVGADARTVYVGSATGGLWKSTNGGLSFTPLSDSLRTSSIGAVAVFAGNPDIVWLGTGEGNPRNSAGVGYGLYKSLDGGRTWTHLGLEQTEHIHRILLHPTDPDIAYVCAMGTFWGENPERGVFKTTDGGRTWTHVLAVSPKTSCGDLVMDPINFNKLFAAMWEFRRWPWFMRSGGPSSGLYLTMDGGAQWTRLTDANGLPQGDLGRIGLAIARGNPNVVYALVEATRSELIRSDDGGRTWRTVNDTVGIANRPFYYADIRVDPTNENRVYNMYSGLTVSEDAGRTWRSLMGAGGAAGGGPGAGIHGDHHALWIEPTRGEIMIDGNDGGVAVSHDKGRTWRFVENLPLAQYYHINVDMETPYNVYGGLQDNGSWRGPSMTWRGGFGGGGGIRNADWTRVGGGDGFGVLSIPGDGARYGYAMSQGGNLQRFDILTGEAKGIRPSGPEGVPLRFNWNAAIAIDPFDGNTVYYGSQFVHKSTDRGESWTTISPDLTTNDPSKQQQDSSGGLTADVTAAENHTTILSIAPSALDRNVIWVGTDDGNVQVTRDGGRTWTTVGRNIRGVPPTTWVPHVEASRFDPAEAFVVFDDHRRSNWTPYVFKTIDYGRTWTSLATPEVWGFVHVIEQDPVNRDLLFLGTEFGLYVSGNGGRSWTRWTGFPTAPVTALIVHARDHDLVIGTHGRSAWVLDDVRPLRALAAQTAAPALRLYEPGPAQQFRTASAPGYASTGHGLYSAPNRQYGALLTYFVGSGNDSARVQFEVADSTGSVIRRFEGPARTGVNREAWNLRRDGPRLAAGTGGGGFGGFGGGPQGPEVLPGTYLVRVRFGEARDSQRVTVLRDPRYAEATLALRAQSLALAAEAQRPIEVTSEAISRLRQALRAIAATTEALRTQRDSASRGVVRSADSLRAAVQAVLDSLTPPTGRQGLFRTEDAVTSQFQGVAGALSSQWSAPTDAQRQRLRLATAKFERMLQRYNAVMAQLAAFKQRAEQAGATPFPATDALTRDWRPPAPPGRPGGGPPRP